MLSLNPKCFLSFSSYREKETRNRGRHFEIWKLLFRCTNKNSFSVAQTKKENSFSSFLFRFQFHSTIDSRSRLVRAVDYAATFAANRRRQGVVLDEAAARLGAFEHPVQRLPSGSRVPGSLIGGNYTSWRPVRGNGSGHRGPRGHSPTEPMSWPRRGGRAGASRSLLPSWWPRGNLRDITHIMRVYWPTSSSGLLISFRTMIL